MVITVLAVASSRLLGLGSKLHPTNMQRMLNKHLTWFVQRIGHFRVSKTLTFKMRPSAQPFSWKWVLFAWEGKTISTSKAEHLTSFDTEAQGNSEMAYSELKTVSKVIEMEKYFARFSNGLSVLHAHHRWPADFCAVHRCYISPGTNSRADFVRFPFHYFKKRQRIKSYKLKR